LKREWPSGTNEEVVGVVSNNSVDFSLLLNRSAEFFDQFAIIFVIRLIFLSEMCIVWAFLVILTFGNLCGKLRTYLQFATWLPSVKSESCSTVCSHMMQSASYRCIWMGHVLVLSNFENFGWEVFSILFLTLKFLGEKFRLC
jgi:hypothetical protein